MFDSEEKFVNYGISRLLCHPPKTDKEWLEMTYRQCWIKQW